MNLSAPFIRRPVATIAADPRLALAGAIAFTCCPWRRCPQVDFPTINVSAGLPAPAPKPWPPPSPRRSNASSAASPASPR